MRSRRGRNHLRQGAPLPLLGKIEKLESRLLLASATYNWQNAAIGAGGFVDGIFFDPNNQNVIYARTDIGGLYKSTNDGANWTQLLDFVGNNTTSSGNGTQSQEIGVLSFAIDPENSNNIYADVGEYTGGTNPNGAVFYSTNAGATWSQTNLSFQVGGNSNGRGDGEQLAVDPNDSNIIFLGSNNAGLWESTNAGHSFTRISQNIFSPTSTTFVLFNPTGTTGSPSQTIYVGIDSTSSGTNLYMTSNGGTSWTQIAGTGSLPTDYLPGHAVLSGGYLYLGYANAEAPNGSITNGGVYRLTPGTTPANGVWANISPKATNGSFGYDGIAADPENPNTIVVTSFDYYSGPDQIWRTVNANASTPSWTELYDYATAQNYGYGGYDTTRNTSNAEWTADFGDGISNWAAAIAINPFNSNQLLYGTGQGIWATNNASNGGTNTQLTGGNSWYFPDTGIEFTAVGGVAAPTSGIPLYSAMGDIGGFANTTLTTSPAQGAVGGSGNAVDYAGTVPNDAVMVGSIGTTNGIYTTNGATFTAFASNPSTGTAYTDGTVAISANGTTIVWAPASQGAYYSTNNGTSWTLATLGASGALPTGGEIVSDKVNSNYFYYWTENSSDNSWTLYISNDGGHTFNASAGGALGTGNASLAVNPYIAGDLWLSTYTGIEHSTNFGASFSHATSYAMGGNTGTMALGAPAPNQTQSTPAIYVYGTLNSFEGIYRSDDGGNTWILLNDVSHQWGGLIQTVAADPNVFGRVYLGINGRGVIIGNPATSLPTNWTDTDINTPGNPGFATSSTTLSTGSTINTWIVNGGGAGLAQTPLSISSLKDVTQSTGAILATAVTSSTTGLHIGDSITIAGATPTAYDGTFVITSIVSSTTFTYYIPSLFLGTATGTITASTSDQFNFASQPTTGDAILTAQLNSLTNADGSAGTPQAGLMFRAGTGISDVFAALLQTSASQLLFEYRSTTSGSISSTTITGIPIAGEYLELVRQGNTFSAYYSSDDIHWTEIGSTITLAAMPSTATAGLAVTANFNPQLASATFSNVAITTITSTQFNSSNQLIYTFNSNAAAALSASSVSLQPLSGGSAISSTGFSYNATTNTATFALPSPIASGIYQATLLNNTFNFLVVNGSDHFALPGSGQTYTVQQLFLNPTATLDVSNNTLIIQYSSGNSPEVTIAAALATGYNNSAWNGPGIVSSTAAADASATTGVGYFDDGTQVTIRDTWYGDANLDGSINADDLSLMLLAQATNGRRWQDGNFNYDPQVDADDWSKFDYVLTYSHGQLLPAFSASNVQPDSISSLLISTAPII
jgi:hypothetical protein